ncbi:MAG: protein kinase, partial [Deltaproteobacteria bacterium]|nr:protein kinase [Deltaproteobacteria bacterium]
MECLDDNLIAAYAERRLEPGERERIEAHLSTCEPCLAIACGTARGDGAATDEVDRIGRYEIAGVLGRGAMGTVYRARDPQLGREVAVKVVRVDRAGGRRHARVAREAHAMAQVRHANAVTVYDAGELDDGAYIAMELVDGDTLGRWLAASPPRAWREVVRMFVQAGRGLAAAHAAGIVHRDFKPANVLVDRSGRAAVTDFGVAAIAIGGDRETRDAGAAPPTADEVVTRTGVLMGTPRYMSPEQLRGARVDARSDQFSFGVALHEALEGRPPYPAERVSELVAQVEAGPPRMSAVPRRIERAIARALSPDRGARFPTMDAMLEALGRAARPRWPIAVGIAACVALIAVVALIARGGSAAAPAAARTRVFVGAFANETGISELDDTLDAIVGAALAASTRADVVAGAELRFAAQQRGVPPSDPEAIAASVPEPKLALVGRVARTAAGLELVVEGAHFAARREVATPEALAAAAGEIASEVAVELGDAPLPGRAALSPSLAAVRAYVAGQTRAIAGDAGGAIAQFRRAVELDGDFATARGALGLALYNVGDRAAAIAELDRAVRAVDRMGERARLTLLGDYYGVAGRYAESIYAYQQLLAKWPGDARTQINMTATAIDANSWALAGDTARAAVATHGGLDVTHRNLILAELGNERLDDAARAGAELLARFPRPPGAGVAAVAIAYALRGRRDEAHTAVARVGTLDEVLGPQAVTDLAMYEGRLDDAAAVAPASAAHHV